MSLKKSLSNDVTGKDSKISRQFLRMVLNCLGKKIPGELVMNSWELYDLIEKDINIMHSQMRRDRKNIRSLLSENEARRQFTIQAIEDFYLKGEGKANEKTSWYEEMEKTKQSKMVSSDADRRNGSQEG